MPPLAPPPEGLVQLQMVDGNPGALCTRGGPETVLLLSRNLVERSLFNGEDQVVPRIHK